MRCWHTSPSFHWDTEAISEVFVISNANIGLDTITLLCTRISIRSKYILTSYWYCDYYRKNDCSVLCVCVRQCVPVENLGKLVLRSVCALTMEPAIPLMALANVSQAGPETTAHRVRTNLSFFLFSLYFSHSLCFVLSHYTLSPINFPIHFSFMDVSCHSAM